MSPTTAFDWYVEALVTSENSLRVEKRADGTLVADFQHVPIEMQTELRQKILNAVSEYPDSIQVKIINEADMSNSASHEPPHEQGGDFIAV